MFTTSADSIKGKSILRDGRVAVCFDDERPPFSFVTVVGHDDHVDGSGRTAVLGDCGSLAATWAPSLAEEYGRRNACATRDGGAGHTDEGDRHDRRDRLTVEMWYTCESPR